MLDMLLCLLLLFTPTPEFSAYSSYAEFMLWTLNITYSIDYEISKSYMVLLQEQDKLSDVA